MPTFYKFLNAEHVDAVCQKGTLIVSSFQYFRDLELTEGPWIGDRLDGATEMRTPEQYVLTEGSKELDTINNANIGHGMFKQFAEVSSGGVIDMSGATFITTTPLLYVFSFSGGELATLRTSMTHNEVRPYDACVRLLSPWRLLVAIMDEGVVVDLDVHFKTLFFHNMIDEVKYSPVSRSVTDGQSIPPSPFLKDVRFSSQCEHRIVFEATQTIPQDRLVIRVPRPETLFELVFPK